MEENIITKPTKMVKIIFWLILGLLSVFFAEVVSGSYMFPLFDIWGIFVIIPIYTLHIILLSYIIFNYGKPVFYTLFIAGAIFGMYEAYLTKVLWSPTWGDPLISLAGIAVIELIVLVFFWHPFMAFIIPLFISETLFTGSRGVYNGLPSGFRDILKPGLKNRFLLISAVTFFGMVQSTNSPSALRSILSWISIGTVIILLVCLLQQRTKGRNYDMRQLLPDTREFKVLLAVLIGMYLVMGIGMRPQALPGLMPQVIIWTLYLFLFILLHRSLRGGVGEILPVDSSEMIKHSWKLIIGLYVLFTSASVISELLFGSIGNTIMLVSWIFWCIIGLITLYRSVGYILRNDSTC